MKYALLADIHGNLPALQAAVEDARANGAQQFMLLGDYCTGLGYPNETVDFMRALPHCHAASGNEDEAFEAIAAMHPSAHPKGQFEAVTWYYNHLTEENRRFLRGLPPELTIQEEGASPITMFHKPERFFGNTAPAFLNPQYYAKCIGNGTFTNQTFAGHAAGMLGQDKALHTLLATLPDGVYAFAHTHIQWAWRQGGKLLVNPGSCGLPLDFDTTAAYALLEWDGTAWQATLKRVAYDVNATLEYTLNSSCAKDVPVWSGIIAKELATAREQAIPFLRFADAFATQQGDDVRPFTPPTWQAAYSAWCKQQ